MKESYGKDRASHPDPKSCVGKRKGVGEALTGAHAGQPSSCEIRSSGVRTPLNGKRREKGKRGQRGERGEKRVHNEYCVHPWPAPHFFVQA
jgi:hypothetical protein